MYLKLGCHAIRIRWAAGFHSANRRHLSCHRGPVKDGLGAPPLGLPGILKVAHTHYRSDSRRPRPDLGKFPTMRDPSCNRGPEESDPWLTESFLLDTNTQATKTLVAAMPWLAAIPWLLWGASTEGGLPTYCQMQTTTPYEPQRPLQHKQQWTAPLCDWAVITVV